MTNTDHPHLGVLLACVDWRLHQPCVGLIDKAAAVLDADGVDLVTVPGPDGLLAPERANEWTAVVKQIRLLIAVHAPSAIAVAGHQRCAGHPVEDVAHDRDVVGVATALKAATEFSGPIHAMMLLYRDDRDWELQTVTVI